MIQSLLNFLAFLGNSFVAAILIVWTRLHGPKRPLPLATSPVEILGILVDPITTAEVLQKVEEFIQLRTPHHIFTADASGIMRAQEEKSLRAIILQADIVTADGFGVMLAAQMRGTVLPERVSGCDLVERISELAAEKGYSEYFFGAAEGVAIASASALKKRYPGLHIAGTRNGFFSEADEARIVREITAAKPDVLFVALGIPKQEQFIRRHFAELGVPVMIGIGGSFDVISGVLMRAPRWMQRSGFEWLYRLCQQPGRLPRLYVLPHFVVEAWREGLGPQHRC